MRKPYQSPGRMKNSSYDIARSGDRTHDLPRTVPSNMTKVSHALTHSAREGDLSTSFVLRERERERERERGGESAREREREGETEREK